MTISVPEPPRSGSYVTVYAYTDQEGGGEDLQARAQVCKTCSALVAEDGLDGHMGLHEALGQGGSGPKSR
jgi:hypothetical protein